MASLRGLAAHSRAGAAPEVLALGVSSHDGHTAQLRIAEAPQSLGVSLETPSARAGWVSGERLLRRGRVIARAWGEEVAGTSVEEEDVAEEAEWTVQDSAALYQLHGWGAPFFSINAAGNLCVRPSGSAEGERDVCVCVCRSDEAFSCTLPSNLYYLASSF